MVSASFQQVSFLGGEWSGEAQGRKTDTNYQRALAKCFNGMPIEESAWTRRPGFRFLGITRQGEQAKLFQFDFSTKQPYQIELTDGKLRLWAGLSLVVADDSSGYEVDNVSTDTPAKVYAPIPSTYADGDTVIFAINSEPCSSPLLCNRQFTIQDVDTTNGHFTLYDPITGDPIDGSTLAWTLSSGGDKVMRVFELVTPYTGTLWKDVRIASNGTAVTLFHPTIQPRSLTLDVTQPFQLNAQDFTDGPYLDINTTSTTLTPSGTSGSITLTASGTAGINNDQGFLSTDVGRAIRFQSAPPAWNSGTTYTKATQVTGSDLNIYQAAQQSLNVDPTTDDGTHWTLVGQEPTWVWMKITAVTDTTHVTVTVMGASSIAQQTPTTIGNTLSSTSAQTVWQLGFFSDTTGWPSLGTYHEGRLWLANAITQNILDDTSLGSSAANRFDGSVSDDFFNFCPTASDGTVSDANGISAILNADEVDAVFWMMSTGDGLLIGTQGSEWRIRASALDDPLSPTNIQARRVSRFGSANMEALLPWGRPVFMQRHTRKMLALRQATETMYDGDNISRLAQQIMSPGISEIRWQQEPTLTIWLRQANGNLAGCVYRSSAYSFSYSQSLNINDENFQGFFAVEHAYERSFESISTGPSYDGLSSALYAVTNQTDNTKSDYNVRHVEYLMPLFDDSIQDWGAFFVDGGATPCCGRRFLRSNGDSFNGVRLYGLTYLNGLTTSVVIGGLDCGDYSVANGYVDVPFQGETGNQQALFTQAFFDAQNNGTNYGVLGSDIAFVQTSTGEAPPFPANSEGAFQDTTSTHAGYAFSDLDTNTRTIYGLNTEDGVYAAFNFDTFANTITDTMTNYLNGLTATSACFTANRFDGFHYLTVSGSPHGAIAKINPTTYAHTVVQTTGSGGVNPDARQFMPMPGGYMAVVGVTSVSSENAVSILNTSTMSWVADAQTLDEDNANLCCGPNQLVFATGTPHSPFTSGEGIGLYRIGLGGYFVKVKSIVPTDIDATWTTFNNSGTATSLCYDAKDNTIIMGFNSTAGSPAVEQYLVKINPWTGAVVWKTPITILPGFSQATTENPCTTLHTGFYGGESGVFYIDTITGAITVTDWAQSGQVYLALGSGYLDPIDGSCTVFGSEASWTTPPVELLGPYSPTHETGGIAAGTINKLYVGLDGDAITTTSIYKAAGSIGLTYTSQGQLLPPDYGYDAGARNGPAFGKKRRTHWYAAQLYRTQAISFGTDFSKLRPARLSSPGGTPVQQPTLYSDVISTTIDDDYSFKSQIAWEISRPYPALITTIGGYIEATDK